ncbi:MAG: DinB family protein [Dehalococcoidia bacterium]
MTVLAPFYAGWDIYNDRLRRAVAGLTPDQLQLAIGPGQWAIWQVVAHIAGARASWFERIGAADAASLQLFADVEHEGWEDHPDQPRGAEELVGALDTTWSMIANALSTWTPDMLDDPFSHRRQGGAVRNFTRQFVLMRLLGHDLSHTGELSLAFAAHGLPEIDLWSPGEPG